MKSLCMHRKISVPGCGNLPFCHLICGHKRRKLFSPFFLKKFGVTKKT